MIVAKEVINKGNMLKIRLTRIGKSHYPVYRLVVAEKSRGVKREFIEILGLYDPCNKENKFSAKKDRVDYWISVGAKPSETANNLLCDFGIFPKDKKIKIIHGKPVKKKTEKQSENTTTAAVKNNDELSEKDSSEVIEPSDDSVAVASEVDTKESESKMSEEQESK